MNLHPELKSLMGAEGPPRNIIFHGPSGVGKYSQALSYLMSYSPSQLQHYKKVKFVKDKFSYMYRISDIHYEIDMSILGCNSRLIWHELFQQCMDIISVQPHKTGIFLCKNFHTVHIDLLDIFYSYMQTSFVLSSLTVRFILLCEHVSFLPTLILENVDIISVRRPSRESYMRLPKFCTGGGLPSRLCHIENIKELYFVCNWEVYVSKRLLQSVSMPILYELKNIDTFSYIRFRDLLYDILVYNVEVSDCLWFIISRLIENGVSDTLLQLWLSKTFMFFKYYNNNYRPIFHLEYMFLGLMVVQPNK